MDWERHATREGWMRSLIGMAREDNIEEERMTYGDLPTQVV